MKKIILATACILALSAGGALAQSQPAPGASSEGNVGPGATTKHLNAKKGVTTGASSGMHTRKGSAGKTSSEGNLGPGTNNNTSKQPGSRY